MLKLLDIFFLLTHLIVIFFNLLGWIWPRTRRVPLWVISITAFSWLAFGLRYGIGYCFLTDWHWNIKRQLGESSLPNSFVKYFLDHFTPLSVSSQLVDQLTAIVFILIVLLTIYVNFIQVRLKKVP